MNDITIALPKREISMLLSALINVKGVPFASKSTLNLMSYPSVIERLKKLRSSPEGKLILTPDDAHNIILGIRAFAEEFGKHVSTYTNYFESDLNALANKLEDVLPKVDASILVGFFK